MPSSPNPTREISLWWHRLVLLAIYLLGSGQLGSSSSALADPPPFETELAPVLEKHCFECHNGKKKEGELDLTKIKRHDRALHKFDRWDNVYKRVTLLEMPPKDQPKPSDEDRAKILRWIEAIPKTNNCEKLASDDTQSFYSGHVMSRRLNRAEYNNTIRDLIGLDLHPADAFPADGSGGEGFDTTGDTLFTSPILLEKYLAAAEQITSAILPDSTEGLSPELTQARQKLLIALPSNELAPRAAAERILARFIPLAFRRPLHEGETARYLALFDKAQARGDSFEVALRFALKGILVSPHFLFLVEPEPEKEGVAALGAYPLASRLSYFLWSSLPDAELFQLAAENKLPEPEVLQTQVRRMSKDPKAKGLADNFGTQWLGIGGLGSTIRPDPAKFPEFDADLAAAMRAETSRLLEHIIRENRSILELLDCNYAFVNQRLAAHYGLPEVKGEELVQVTLPDGRRGGLLGQASVLTVTSYPLRTSPVLRGRWVLEELLGSKVPPPPPNAGTLPPEEPTAQTRSLREQLDLHRSKAECASCHARMDPIGFGLENFDPIGRWREEVAGQKLDTSGKLPSGETFATPADLKQILLTRKQEVIRHLCRKLFGYALGRELNHRFDQCVLDNCWKALEDDEFRSSHIFEEIVLSYPFTHRFVKK